MHTPRPYSEKWMFHASSFILSFICRRKTMSVSWAETVLLSDGTHGFGPQVLRRVPVVQLQQTLAGRRQPGVVVATLVGGVRGGLKRSRRTEA